MLTEFAPRLLTPGRQKNKRKYKTQAASLSHPASLCLRGIEVFFEQTTRALKLITASLLPYLTIAPYAEQQSV